MRKVSVALGAILIALVIGLGAVPLVVNLLNQKPLGIADKTENVNVMLTRPANWRKIANEPVISQDDMDIIDGSTATIPITAELLRQFFDLRDGDINSHRVVYHSTTHEAYLKLINSEDRFGYGRNTSLIFVTPPSDEELNYAAQQGVELDITPIAKDGFVFITHKDNPVDSLTVEQIQDIYTGKITNWKEVGGKDLEIKAYQREKNSGSQTAMEQMVMQGKSMISPITANVYMGMGALIEAVAEYENGPASIGYTYNYYINNLYKNENIKVIKINGVSPTNENLISGAYAFSTSYYAVIRKNEPQESPARKLRDYLLTKEGQEIIAMAGYCKAVN